MNEFWQERLAKLSLNYILPMKYILVFLLCLTSLKSTLHGQSILGKPYIGYNGEVKFDSIKNPEIFASKIHSSITLALDSITKKYQYGYKLIQRDSLKEMDLWVEVVVRYSPISNNQFGDFKYQTDISFISIGTDSLVAAIRPIFKNLEAMSDVRLIRSFYDAFDKIFSKVAIPLNSILEPSPSLVDKKCLCLYLSQFFKTDEQNRKIGRMITDVVNNAVVFNQKNNLIVYFPVYRNETIRRDIPKDCNPISGTLTNSKGHYILQLSFGDKLNLLWPTGIRTMFYISKGQIETELYLGTVWRISKSINALIENNSLKVIPR